MLSSNILYHYWHFSRKHAQIRTIFYLSQNLLSEQFVLSDNSIRNISVLNKHRIIIQKEIGELTSLLLPVCEECRSKCCRGNIDDYYSSIDYWLRKYSFNTILKNNISSLTPWYHCIVIRLKQLARKYIDSNEKARFDINCIYLKNNGCELEFSNRPIECSVATCDKLRRAMNKQIKIEYIKFIKKLYSICYEVFDIIKVEAGLPRRHGRLSITFTF